MFPSTKQNRLPITKDIFKKIIKTKLLSVINLNINTIFKFTLTGFIRIEKLTYTIVDVKKTMFTKTNFTRSDISFT